MNRLTGEWNAIRLVFSGHDPAQVAGVFVRDARFGPFHNGNALRVRNWGWCSDAAVDAKPLDHVLVVPTAGIEPAHLWGTGF
jgi:hypothetical protein